EPCAGGLAARFSEREREHTLVVVRRRAVVRTSERVLDRLRRLELAESARRRATRLRIRVGERLEQPRERDTFGIPLLVGEASGEMSQPPARRPRGRSRARDALVRHARGVLRFDAKDCPLGVLRDVLVLVSEKVEQLTQTPDGRRETGFAQAA